MDEAFSALDPLIRREMQEKLVELQAELGRPSFSSPTTSTRPCTSRPHRRDARRRIVQVGTPEHSPTRRTARSPTRTRRRPARVLTASGVMEPARAVSTTAGGPRPHCVKCGTFSPRRFSSSARRVLVGAVRDKDVLRQVAPGVTTSPNHEACGLGGQGRGARRPRGSVESPLPIAVVDEKNQLFGVIPRVTLLAALGNVSTNTAETPVIDNPMTIPINIITQTLRRAAADAATLDGVPATTKGASA